MNTAISGTVSVVFLHLSGERVLLGSLARVWEQQSGQLVPAELRDISPAGNPDCGHGKQNGSQHWSVGLLGATGCR